MKFFVFAFFAFVGFSSVLCQTLLRELSARRAARQCTREFKLNYDVAVKFSKGDFSDDSSDAKCFLKCFANKIKFFNDTGDLQKDVLLSYVQFVTQDNISASDIVDQCTVKVNKGEDECEYAFEAYKCFWEGINKVPEAGSTRDALQFSLYDVLGFNRLYDEEDIESKPVEQL